MNLKFLILRSKIIAQIKPKQSILIHSGAGGVGQAAINLALHYNCNIFTTVGTKDKKNFIINKFPQIPESHIGNSRDTSFEQMILTETNGQGVDIILNSLSEEKLQASLRCLAAGGKFLEIGKYDLFNNNLFALKRLDNNKSFNGIMIDNFLYGSADIKQALNVLLSKGIEMGFVKPLIRTVFEKDQMEEAFRYFSRGKHIGKIMIKLREEEPRSLVVPTPETFSGLARFYCMAEYSYIVIGGLGGLGLELIDWLVLRGARKIVIVSRHSVKTGYQASRIKVWNTYGATIKVVSGDMSNEEVCIRIIREAQAVAPVKGVFNLAAVIKDALFENQTIQHFNSALTPKSTLTANLDIATRKLCPELEHFVVFSSASCGIGNVGQSNYGMANSIMERICEKRKRDGYPVIAIQWGAIREVGLTSEMKTTEVAGLLKQSISSCLYVMDTLLTQKEPIVESIVVAEKQKHSSDIEDIISIVKKIIGIKDFKTINSRTTFSELGVDSIMAVEINQVLNRRFELFLTAQDIWKLTFTRLEEIVQQKSSETKPNNDGDKKHHSLPVENYLMLTNLKNEEYANEEVVRLPSLVKETDKAPKIFLLPDFSGSATCFKNLAAKLTAHVFCLQFLPKTDPHFTIEEMCKSFFPMIKRLLSKTESLNIVAYSYGCSVAIQLAGMLENEGRIGKIILVDGGPAFSKELLRFSNVDLQCEQSVLSFAFYLLVKLFASSELALKYKDDINNCKSFDDGLQLLLAETRKAGQHEDDYIIEMCSTYYARIKTILNFQPNLKLESEVKLYKTQVALGNLIYDYGLQNYCKNTIDVISFEANHITILNNPNISKNINKFMTN